MKLISTIEEVQEHLPIQMTNYLETVKPFISSAERAYILMIIGRNQFNALVALYEAAEKNTANIQDPIIREALEFCQKIEAALGYFHAIPVLSVKIGTTGIQVFSNNDTKQAFNWQVDDLKKALLNIGFTAIEDLLILMDENPDLFPMYIDSEQYKASEQYLIESATDFTQYFNIAKSRYIFSSIAYVMRRIEDHKVRPLFGAAFFQDLKEDKLQGKYAILANDYIKPGIALLTAAKAIVERIITFENGVASINLIGNYDAAKNNMPATRDDILAATSQLESDGSRFLSDGVEFLKSNQADFPNYVPPVRKSSYNIKNNSEGGIFAI